MSDVRMNPGDLRHFVRFLTELDEELAASNRTVLDAFDELSREWRDERFLAFSSKFQETMVDVEGFRREARRYAEHLTAKARLADRFLDT